MKHRIITHVACTGDGAKIHYEAMKWKKEMKRTQTQATSGMNVLVRSALPIVKNCAAAQNYPKFVADKAMCGVDCGYFGHIKEEFKNIINVAES